LLVYRWRQSSDPPFESPVRKSIDVEFHGLAGAHVCDRSFRHISVKLQGAILNDRDDRAVAAQELAHSRRSILDESRKRRSDPGISELLLGKRQGSFPSRNSCADVADGLSRRSHGGIGRIVLRLLGVKLLLRNHARLGKFFGSLQSDLCIGESGFGLTHLACGRLIEGCIGIRQADTSEFLLQRRLLLMNIQIQLSRVQLGDDLSGLNRIAEIDEQLFDRSLDLIADGHFLIRVERPYGVHRSLQLPRFNLCGFHRHGSRRGCGFRGLHVFRLRGGAARNEYEQAQYE
jgi:hypothetical protein